MKMNPTHINSFCQWAQQIYGPPSETLLNAHNAVEQLVHAKNLRNRSASDITSPSKQPLPRDASRSDGTPSIWDNDSWDDESFFEESTQKTTPESFATTGPTQLSFTTNNGGAPTQKNTGVAWQNIRATSPGPLILMDQWMYSTLDRIDQLEFLVTLKIKTFRERISAPYVFRNPQLWRIDREEGERRRQFFEKNGEEAFLSCYVNSDYVGRVEFHYIDPKEVY